MESSLFDEDIDPESFTETILNKSAPPETFQLKILLEGEIELYENFPRKVFNDNSKSIKSEGISKRQMLWVKLT